MNAEATSDEFFRLILKIVSGETPSNQLALFLEEINSYFSQETQKLRDFLEEAFPEVICEEINEIINDATWRSDEVGPNVIRDENILRDLYKVVCKIDQNCEVVFATNPHIPRDVVDELCNSDYEWEEDGTTNALARNTKDADILQILSRSKDPSTRYSVAANIHTPLEVLTALSKDEDFSNHRLYLAFDGGWYGTGDIKLGYVECSIKFAVINNPVTPINVIKNIAEQSINFNLDNTFSCYGIQATDVNQTIQSVAYNIIMARANT